MLAVDAAHNPKVPGSNPGPATKKHMGNREVAVPPFYCFESSGLHASRYLSHGLPHSYLAIRDVINRLPLRLFFIPS